MPVVIHCPLGVRFQTRNEAVKFGIQCEVAVVDDPSEIINGINLINYEKLHKFDSKVWGGVVLDESSILKSFTGTTKQMLVEAYKETTYRLACTATPAPNDHKELGNHSEFLGVLPSNEMLSRWFINDTMNAGGYRLKGHAKRDFWHWVSQWAVCASNPSDIGGSDEGYILPEIEIERHYVLADSENIPEGFIFRVVSVSATTIHDEKRATNTARSRKAAELASGTKDQVLVWCQTDYEADQLKKDIPEAIEVRGGTKNKEELLLGFAKGEFRILITKPGIAGFGLNYQNCNHMIFAGLSYSFEEYYQSVRRCWRFGQQRPVKIDIIVADSDAAIESAVARKESDHLLMQSEMADAVKQYGLGASCDLVREFYSASNPIVLPSFLRGVK
jgi:superfamily II DNA or RNA helicase